MAKLDRELHAKLKKLINSMGYDFVGGELLPQGRMLVLRIYADGLEASLQKGVTVDDCSRISQQVSAMLDVEELITGRYVLEVSSPGLDRPLFELAHYQKWVGSRVQLRLQQPVEGRRQVKGTLVRVEGDDIYVLVEGMEHEMKLPFGVIEKANVIADIRF